MRARSILPARLARSPRARLLALPLLLSAALVVECPGSSGSWASASVRGAAARASSLASADSATAPGSAAPITWVTTVPTGRAPSDIVTNCVVSSPALCHTPHLLRVAYGIQSLLDRGIDGRGETITVVSPAPAPSTSDQSAGSSQYPYPPAATDIRQDLAAYDSEYRLPAARIEVVTNLAGSASPWEATDEEVGNFEVLHTVAPGATLRVVMLPSNVVDSVANATSDMLAALRLAVSHTDVASINWCVGEHYFTAAQVVQMQSILRWAAAHHVTVDDASGDAGASSDPYPVSAPLVKEVSLPASDPLVLSVGGTALTASLSTGAYISETAMTVPGIGGVSGGGFSHLYARPAYQDGVPGISTTRGVPDVSGAGEGGIPYTFAAGGKTYLIVLIGTSGSAPLWGGEYMPMGDSTALTNMG
jgi:subtilase family serine protease